MVLGQPDPNMNTHDDGINHMGVKYLLQQL